MGTTLATFRQKVLLGFPRTDAEAVVAVDQGINDAIQIFSQMEDFDEHLVQDKTSADTVDGTSTYHIIDTWGLTRPKKILSLVLEDTSSSLKLTYIPQREFDAQYPYPTTYGEARPTIYTTRGLTVELFRTPDAAYDVHIAYVQYPAALTTDAGECTILNFDQQIVFLAKDIANAYLSGQYVDFQSRAREIMKMGILSRRDNPDKILIAQPFIADRESYPADYWADPMYRRVR